MFSWSSDDWGAREISFDVNVCPFRELTVLSSRLIAAIIARREKPQSILGASKLITR